MTPGDMRMPWAGGVGQDAPAERVLTNAHIVTPDAQWIGTICVREGRIHDVARGGSTVPAAEDLDGDFLIPGLVDLHTDNLEKHFKPRPNVRWHPVMAAVAHDNQVVSAAVTTVFDSLALVGGRRDGDREATLAPMVGGIVEAMAASMLRAEHFLHLRCEVSSPRLMELLEPYLDHPLLRFLSFMDHTPGERQYRDLATWRKTFRDYYGYGEADLDRVLAERTEEKRRYAAGFRERVVAFAHARRLPIASHDDQTVEHVEEAAAAGVRISEFPVTVEAARHARRHGMHVLMGAPNLVLGGSHSGNVAAADLAKEGLLDVLASDYVPASLLHAAMLLTGDPFGYSLPQAINTVTANPADAAGLGDRGALVAGLRGDLVRFRLAATLPAALPVVRAVWRAGRRVA